ncbi:MAG: imidazole glycerol phosphate synthase subunit HisH [Candidatus Diapherotrites archaeon]|nr:imidazole glycerol phosphate synthase subunit HisH [Candidatus Diapherotrites archaeon]
MIAIVDYGMGNIRSVEKALQKAGAEVVVTSDAEAIREADGVVVPGVGAFDSAMKRLGPFREAILGSIEDGKPFLGICLGMQVLVEKSEEGKEPGLGVVKGRVVRFRGVKTPHVGWNQLEMEPGCPLFKGIPQESRVYFVHSYYAVPGEQVIASKTEYGTMFCSAIWKKNVLATQFHPEKSGEAGLKMLKNFVELVE